MGVCIAWNMGAQRADSYATEVDLSRAREACGVHCIESDSLKVATARQRWYVLSFLLRSALIVGNHSRHASHIRSVWHGLLI